MKNVQVSRSDVKGIVAKLFDNGKTPSERFGLTWKQLSELERNVPELTCKTGEDHCKTA
ncbi:MULTISPECIES: hypothetical protein [Vibrio harveyi group]|uniref:hypothetical protein n=1 Tax=Vibrio harveyi group TaxID=717610 RepID=UPI0015D9C1C6|nr:MULTISPECIES: hypothetical protein [Vibrio harveyi group]MBE5145597.1 hypothetical protein [Vibrio parahaemolyticus]MBT0052664.1 hypothetical protein [Vibrio alginolyticus]MCR9374497.1 hypothetical protein [Vibrio alginolyticus]MCR9408470.1 hypothetical protein [Vibrio alginolyticus]